MQINWRKCSVILSVILLEPIIAVPCPPQDSQRQKPEQSSQQNLYRDQAQKPQQNLQQQDTQSYAGKVSERHGKFYLEEARSKTAYQLEGTWSAKRYLGRRYASRAHWTRKRMSCASSVFRLPPKPLRRRRVPCQTESRRLLARSRSSADFRPSVYLR